MDRGMLIVVLAIALVGLTGQAWGATEDSITITVSLESVVSISVTPDTWAIGAIGLATGHELTTVALQNDGTEKIVVSVRATDGANGWVLGDSPGLDTFTVRWDVPHQDLILRTTDQEWITHIAGGESVIELWLRYEAPTQNSQPTGVDHGFTVTFSAAAYTP